jgi:hypothetical protein
MRFQTWSLGQARGLPIAALQPSAFAPELEIVVVRTTKLLAEGEMAG